MTVRNYTNTATEGTLAAGITSATTTLTLSSFAGYPTVPFIAVIDRGTADEEIVLVTSAAAGSAVATRGYDGTTAKSHATGATFAHAVAAKDFAEANTHVNTAAGVHGLAGSVVGTTDTQTLSNKTLVSPTTQSPTITGSATATSLTVSTSLTVPTPTLGTHAATKAYADGVGTELPTVSTIVRRDAAGRFQAVAASAAADVVIKSQLDATNTAVGLKADTTALALKAPLASPTFTGTVTVPTPTVGGAAANKTYADARETTAKSYADAQIDALWNTGTNFTGTAALTAASGWTTQTGSFVRKVGPRMAIALISLVRSGADIVIGDTGDLANITVGTIRAGFEPYMVVPLVSTSGGRAAHGELQSGGDIRLCSMGNGININTDDPITLAVGLYFTAS